MSKLYSTLFDLKIKNYSKAVITYKGNEIHVVELDSYDILESYPTYTVGYAAMRSKVISVKSEASKVAYVDIRPLISHRKIFKGIAAFKERVKTRSSDSQKFPNIDG